MIYNFSKEDPYMKRIVCVALAFMMLSCLLVISPNETHAASPLSAGLSFDATSKYCFDKSLPQIPTTIEATILLPADFSDSGHTGGAPALRTGAIAQSPGREAALCRASLPKPCPASSVRAREGAGCGSVGAVSGA